MQIYKFMNKGTGMGLRHEFRQYVAAGVTGLMLGAASVPAIAQDGAQTLTDVSTLAPAVEVAGGEHTQQPLQGDRTITIKPHLPVNILFGMGGAFLLGCGIYAGRRHKGAAFYALSGGVLTAALLNPQNTFIPYEPQPTEVAVVIDRSQSQMTGDRLDATLRAGSDIMAQLRAMPNVEIRLIEVDGLAASSGLRPGTGLFSVIEERLSDIPRSQLGGIIVVTDGQISDAPEYASVRDGEVPFHVLLSGNALEIDRHILIESAPAFAVNGDRITIEYSIADMRANDADTQTQIMPPQNVAVTISVNGEEVASQTVSTGQTQSFEYDFTGFEDHVVSIVAAPLQGELTLENNAMSVRIDGVRDTADILVLSAQPDRMDRVLRDVIASAPDNNLTHFTYLRDDADMDMTPLGETSNVAYPLREIFGGALSGFEVVILDNVGRGALLPQRYAGALNEYVQNGGSLFVIAGDNADGLSGTFRSPAAESLPIENNVTLRDNFFTPEVFQDNIRHPVTRMITQSTPSGAGGWGAWQGFVQGTPTDGRIILQNDEGHPLLILHEAGEGRVAALMSDSAWLWHTGFQGGGPFEEMLNGTLDWLSHAPEMEEEGLSAIVSGNTITIERQTMEAEIQPVILADENGGTLTVTMEETLPGLWRGIIESLNVGTYTVTQGDFTATAYIEPSNPREMEQIISTGQYLRPIVENHNGFMARIESQPEFTIGFAGEAENGSVPDMEIRRGQAHMIADIQQKPLLPDWAYLLMFAGAIAGALYRQGEWTRRQLYEKTFGRASKNDGGNPSPAP